MDISKLLEKAREAAERRNYDYAIALYKQACELDPNSTDGRRELRAVQIRMSKEKPVSFMGKAKLMANITKAQGLYAAKKYDGCINACEDALVIDPGHVGMQVLLGKALAQAGHLDTAIQTFEDVRKTRAGGDNKALVEASRNLGFAYEGKGEIMKALDIWSEVYKINPGDRDAGQKIRDLSASDMTKKIESGTKDASKGSLARSIAKDSKVVQRQERDHQEIRSEQDLHAAIQDAKDDVAKNPEDPRYISKLGDLYRKAGNYAEAKSAYEKAVSLEAVNPQWKFKLHDLDIWKMTNEINELIGKVKAGEANLKDDVVKRRQSLLEFRLKTYIEREKLYSTDSGIRHTLGGIYFDLAEVKKDRALYDEAIKRYQQTFRDPKFRIEAGLRMGLGFARKEQYDLALKRFDETLATLEVKDERWKNLQYAKADTLENSNKRQEALAAFLEVYEVDVAFRDVSARVEKLQKAAGGGDDASAAG